MKKLFILGFAFLSFSAVSFASDGGYAFLSKLNQTNRLQGLAYYLQANPEQQIYLKQIAEMSTKKLAKAQENGSLSDQELQKALAFNLANTKSILTPEQYKKYVTLLNVTSYNNSNGELFANK